MNIRDNSYRTPLLAAAQAKLPGHVQRLLMAKVRLIFLPTLKRGISGWSELT
jgi:hypothetical protein